MVYEEASWAFSKLLSQVSSPAWGHEVALWGVMFILAMKNVIRKVLKLKYVREGYLMLNSIHSEATMNHLIQF